MTLEELEKWFMKEVNKPKPPIRIYCSEKSLKIWQEIFKEQYEKELNKKPSSFNG